mmetsp:Transcript_35239/g.40203  ORF Transcript_35239/g.40203 Transcript_35239/m.40203 type:complete len:85 (-) Transcript_35239:189-443(-)
MNKKCIGDTAFNKEGTNLPAMRSQIVTVVMEDTVHMKHTNWEFRMPKKLSAFYVQNENFNQYMCIVLGDVKENNAKYYEIFALI